MFYTNQDVKCELLRNNCDQFVSTASNDPLVYRLKTLRWILLLPSRGNTAHTCK